MQSIAELNYRKGVALHGAGDFAGALAAFDAALSVAPQLAAALYNKAMVLIQLQRWQDALAALDELVRTNPGIADAWNNRSGVLQALGRNQEALESMQNVLKLRPSDARALYNAGLILLVLKRFDEAQGFLTRALAAAPDNGEILGSLVSAALRACDWETLEPLLPRLFSGIRSGTAVIAPLSLLALSDDAILQRRCAELTTAHSLAAAALGGSVPPMAQAAFSHDRIRIGYLSSDFGDHPVAAQIVGLLERHDRSRFEITGLFTGREDGSARYNRIVKACDRFLPVGQIGARQAAALIHEAEIDILVDLNGHTMGWRPAILKYRPAPVIATFLGYAGTTGADFVDYIIGDPYVTSFEMGPSMSEKIVQLPNCFWPSDPALLEPEAVSRAEAGLPAGAFVFCCFNSNHKIRPQMLDLWARLLKSVDDAVLWIRGGSPGMDARFLEQTDARGIDRQRIVFAGRMDSFARHLGRQAHADLFLDTFPYNAHATASDALWAGLPVVTLRGESFVSRVSSSLLTNIGLEELVASTPQAYEAVALSLARDRNRLGDLQRKLKSARKTTALFDMDRFAAGIEAAYSQMQARARRGESPEAFKV